jgi:hypothetical protein
MTSGAVQQGVPQRVIVAFSSLMRANPKSATFTFQFSSTCRFNPHTTLRCQE